MSSTATLRLIIDDINDHAPVFGLVLYQLSVSESADVNAEVGRIVATDEDSTPNNRLQYSIENGADGKFFIDRNAGMYILK